MYKYLRKTWSKMKESGIKELMKERAIKWRKGRSIIIVDKPTRLDRARALGYKAKPGVIVARVRIRRGGLRKPRPSSGRRQKRMGVMKHVPAISIKRIAEERVAKKFPYLKVVNSYWLWEDGKYKWYETILIDPANPSIINDPDLVRFLRARDIET